MNFRFFSLVGILISFTSCSLAQENKKESELNETLKKEWNSSDFFISNTGVRIDKMIKSDSEWEKELNQNEYYVLRKKGTERAFTSELLKINKEGIYVCGACGLPLFDSKTKFKSGTGWPSFYAPVEESFILSDTDYDLGYARTEVMCMRCQGHLGHVFDDGPKPTGLRYCINGVSLDFEEGKSSSELIGKITVQNK